MTSTPTETALAFFLAAGLLVVAGFALCFLVQPSSAAQLSVAYGDSLHYTANDAPYFITILGSQLGYGSNATDLIESQSPGSRIGQMWVFGSSDYLLAIPFAVDGSTYTISIDKNTIANLPEGNYDMYLQFPGKSGALSFSYNEASKKFTSPLVAMNSIDAAGLTPGLIKETFLSLKNDPATTDLFTYDSLTIENPKITITHNYNYDSTRDMGLSGTTNMAAGDTITAIIDPDKYAAIPEYAEIMSASCIVTGNESSFRDWSLKFHGYAASNLTHSTQHTIAIYLNNDIVYTVPFSLGSNIVQPTPPPEQDYYFMINHTYNNTPPATSVNITRLGENTTYQTTLSTLRLGCRTIMNRDTIYIGETNLNIYGTLGWPDFNDGNWYAQYCDAYAPSDYGRVIKILNPKHFNVTQDIFKNDYGAWCQYSTYESGKDKQPIAFIVKPNPVDLTTVTIDRLGNIIINNTQLNEIQKESIATNLSEESFATENTTGPAPEPTMAIQGNNTPSEQQTDESNLIQQPLPSWIVLAALCAGGVLWKTRR